jgi:hypothetical protein
VFKGWKPSLVRFLYWQVVTKVVTDLGENLVSILSKSCQSMGKDKIAVDLSGISLRSWFNPRKKAAGFRGVDSQTLNLRS